MPLVDLIKNRVEDLPGGRQLIGPDEQPLVAVDHVQQEALVRVGDLVVVVPGLTSNNGLGKGIRKI